MQIKETKNIRKYNSGYEVRDELISGAPLRTKDFVLKRAYDTKTGLFVGDPKFARIIYTCLKIKPEPISLNSTMVRIGFCRREKSWYAWDQNNIRSFKVGDVIDENDILSKVVPVGTEIKTISNARMAAIEYVKLIS